MGFSLPTLVLTALGRPPKLVCASHMWHEGVDELGRRAAGQRESGAFLLGRAKGRRLAELSSFFFTTM